MLTGLTWRHKAMQHPSVCCRFSDLSLFSEMLNKVTSTMVDGGGQGAGEQVEISSKSLQMGSGDQTLERTKSELIDLNNNTTKVHFGRWQ